ncbi:unnamed protein product [Lota lota]
MCDRVTDANGVGNSSWSDDGGKECSSRFHSSISIYTNSGPSGEQKFRSIFLGLTHPHYPSSFRLSIRPSCTSVRLRTGVTAVVAL